MCLTKYQRTTFLNYCWLYIFKVCALGHAVLVEKTSALLWCLDGFGIAVTVISY